MPRIHDSEQLRNFIEAVNAGALTVSVSPGDLEGAKSRFQRTIAELKRSVERAEAADQRLEASTTAAHETLDTTVTAQTAIVDEVRSRAAETAQAYEEVLAAVTALTETLRQQAAFEERRRTDEEADRRRQRRHNLVSTMVGIAGLAIGVAGVIVTIIAL